MSRLETPTRMTTIEAQLADKGMRVAHQNEQGWYVTVLVDGKPKKVWATDEASRSGRYVSKEEAEKAL